MIPKDHLLRVCKSLSVSFHIVLTKAILFHAKLILVPLERICNII